MELRHKFSTMAYELSQEIMTLFEDNDPLQAGMLSQGLIDKKLQLAFVSGVIDEKVGEVNVDDMYNLLKELRQAKIIETDNRQSD